MSDEPTVAPPSRTLGAGAPGTAAIPDLSMAVGTSAGATRASPEPPKLDGYDVITAIGEGGMGTVWRAVQLSTRRDVAIKLISTAALASDRARQRFDREVEITARLEHPNIARVYDSGLNRGVYFYAMELIDGLPLDQYVSRRELTRPDVLRLFAAICRAVDHAHVRGVIHRDLKPGNILITADGQPHVLDFGLAKALLQAGKESGISLDGEVAGTPGFMAPEQAAGLLDIDARCDVYSLGVILYRVLTGQSPHDLSGSYLDILRRVSDEEPRRPRDADKTMDRELEALLLRALQRDPAHRYKTAGDLARDVEAYLAGDPITAKPPTLLYFASKRVRKYRIRLATIGIVALLIGLAALLTVRLVHSHHKMVEEAAKTLQKERESQIADGNSAILAGDKSMEEGNWSASQSNYVKAAELLTQGGALPLKARLALWDLARTAPPPLATIPSPGALSAAPAIFHDGHRALAGFDDGSVKLLDLTSGATVKTIAAHDRPVRCVAVCGDGSFAITGSDGGSLKVWDLQAARLKAALSDSVAPLKNQVTRLAISPNGRLALSASGATVEAMMSPSYNDTLTLWDVESGRPLFRTDRAAGVFDARRTVTQAVFAPDSSIVATASGEIAVWNVGDGKRVAVIPESATAVSFSTDGSAVAAGSSDGSIRVLDLATKQIERIQEHGSAVLAIWFDNKSGRIIVATEDGAFRAIDRGGAEIWSQPSHGEINSATLSRDGTIALTADDKALSTWRMSPPTEARQLAVGGPFADVSLSADGRLALGRSARRGFTIGADPGACLVDTITGKSLNPAPFTASRCNAIAMSRDGKNIAQLAGQVLEVWSVDPPREIRRFTIKTARSDNKNVAIAINDDGSKIATGSDDNSIVLYRVTALAEPINLTGHAGAITSISFGGNGHLLLTGSDDQTARLWNADSGVPISTLRGHQSAVNAVALSQDGRLAVTGSGAASFQDDIKNSDNTVRVWQIPSGNLVTTLPSVAGRVRSVAISGDGHLIAAGCDDQTVTLYSCTPAETGTAVDVQVLRTVRSQNGVINALDFDATGRALLCGGEYLGLWEFAKK